MMQITSRNETSIGFKPGGSGLANERLSSRNTPMKNKIGGRTNTHNPVFRLPPYDEMFLLI